MKYISIICVLLSGYLIVSCEEYLNDVPKGTKTPTTLADFEAFIRDENRNQTVNIPQALNLLNDKNNSLITLSYSPLEKANYMWDETADRIGLENSTTNTYYTSYAGISSFNIIIENVLNATESTEEQRKMVWAQAKVLRSMSYYCLVNYYADTYQIYTASLKLAVPLITSAKVNAPSRQVSIQEMYDFILNDITEAVPYLPKVSQTPLHPNLGTAYAFYSRIYLQMNNYPKALKYADLALEENNKLYDWITFYESYKEIIDKPSSYIKNPSPMGYYYNENYNFRHGTNSVDLTEYEIPCERAKKFENGDARFLARWKQRTVAGETYYASILSGMFNYGGITTTEVYLVKAECLARTNQIDSALGILNKIRKTRILPSYYKDFATSDRTAAVKAIIKLKNNELILTLIPFADARRLNAEGIYKNTLTKIVDGQTYTLTSNSHLWTMPFPFTAVQNPGNGTLTQNVEK
ncbi:starch-binding protein [Flavobacterium plurextorum]|uniref:Starch-binding protein n=1 Tax=Flavobacterium plurextorum TaxID=1114867 RepID=A0ABX4CPU7_9FLAO|nr:RagB/SusD family nutrient uptake outer membrane protein [Flavobacterium plurextorum]OXB03360.1 starch-binding protein [Flavobacterium plurextorum]